MRQGRKSPACSGSRRASLSNNVGGSMVEDSYRVEHTHHRIDLTGRTLAMIAGLLVLVLVLILAIAKGASGSAALFPVKLRGKYGYIDKAGKIAITPQFDDAEEFSEGYAP